jgi:hypothetical protein
MKAIQLELDFRNAIALALAEPEVADLRQLWRSLCGRYSDVSISQRKSGQNREVTLFITGKPLCF